MPQPGIRIYIPKVVYPENPEQGIALTPTLNLNSAIATCKEDAGRANTYFVSEYVSVTHSMRMEFVRDHEVSL